MEPCSSYPISGKGGDLEASGSSEKSVGELRLGSMKSVILNVGWLRRALATFNLLR